MVASYKVSVIIPIYNVAEYLEECLDSMVNQTIDSLGGYHGGRWINRY